MPFYELPSCSVYSSCTAVRRFFLMPLQFSTTRCACLCLLPLPVTLRPFLAAHLRVDALPMSVPKFWASLSLPALKPAHKCSITACKLLAGNGTSMKHGFHRHESCPTSMRSRERKRERQALVRARTPALTAVHGGTVLGMPFSASLPSQLPGRQGHAAEAARPCSRQGNSGDGHGHGRRGREAGCQGSAGGDPAHRRLVRRLQRRQAGAGRAPRWARMLTWHAASAAQPRVHTNRLDAPPLHPATHRRHCHPETCLIARRRRVVTSAPGAASGAAGRAAGRRRLATPTGQQRLTPVILATPVAVPAAREIRLAGRLTKGASETRGRRGQPVRAMLRRRPSTSSAGQRQACGARQRAMPRRLLAHALHAGQFFRRSRGPAVATCNPRMRPITAHLRAPHPPHQGCRRLRPAPAGVHANSAPNSTAAACSSSQRPASPAASCRCAPTQSSMLVSA